MLSFFLNPLMLLGLAGVSLPVIAHLLSRRRYDVVEWGAMQFLNPSRRTKRRMRLEELLLLLIRMGAVGLLAFAAARPWINSGFLTGYRSAGSRDVVLVIDGSNSMSRSDGLTSLHQKAVRRAVEFLQSLRPGDTVGIIDARDRPIRITDSTLQNPEAVQQQLEEMSPPAGAADLKQACEEAVGMLGRCSNGAREIIVLTDRQRSGWSLSQDAAWQRFDDVMRFPSVRPKVWVIDVAAGLSPLNHNVSVGQLELSRDLTVPNFPVSLQIPVRNSGSESTNVPLQILVNGQRMADLDSTVSVAADSETVFSRSIRFQSEGTNLVTVRAEVPDDTVAADNESHAAVRVTSAIPALLVESSEDHDPRRANTFFASLALTAPQNKSPWINATTVHVRNLTAQDIRKAAVVVLPDVPGLSTESVQALLQFLNQGHGLWITLGKSTTADTFQKLYQDSGILPTIKLRRIRQASPGATSPTTIAPYSLEAAWLNRFRERDGASLTQATFDQWWQIENTIQPPENMTRAETVQDGEIPAVAAIQDHRRSDAAELPSTIAQLTSGDPLLLQTRRGRGTVLLMTSNLDASWNSLPTRPDYVPFVHEALFQMAASSVQRNVGFGEPLTSVLDANKFDDQSSETPHTDETAGQPGADRSQTGELTFRMPFEGIAAAEVRRNGDDQTATLAATRLPGVYRLVSSPEETAELVDAFVVNYDHAEDNPAELTEDDRARLIVHDRMKFVESMDALRELMYGNESRSELWAALMWLFLGLLIIETWMTRRLVLQGHADTEASATA